MLNIYIRFSSICFFVLFLAACGGHEPLKPNNPMGLSGKINTEAETAYARARVLWKDGEICTDPKLAVELLDKAITLEPKYAEAYLRRGLAKSDLRDWDGAFDDLSRSIRIKSTAEAYAYRGLISMRGGNSIGARKDLGRSIEMNPGQHRAWNFRGALSLLEGDQVAACKDFDKGCSNGDCIGYESAVKSGACK